MNNLKLIIRADRTPQNQHRGSDNSPTTNEVAILLVDILYCKDGLSYYINISILITFNSEIIFLLLNAICTQITLKYSFTDLIFCGSLHHGRVFEDIHFNEFVHYKNLKKKMVNTHTEKILDLLKF
ncbi:Uncharacterized protein FWK35_00016077 [Aphis craccivora]|uniref:Uncharacterized protein n=1 Tax=Aphis craccivora TaxID=307492 RepID=A0A6G0ZBP3_APHCR|nr:Uncharacterized protein FWK35_00016077 [Aphis craccivora]